MIATLILVQFRFNYRGEIVVEEIVVLPSHRRSRTIGNVLSLLD